MPCAEKSSASRIPLAPLLVLVATAILLTCLGVTAAYAAEGTLQEIWAHTWGGNGTEQVSAVAVDRSGTTCIAGQTTSFGAGGGDVLLIKYSPGGKLLWRRAWGGGNDDAGSAVAVDPTDRFVYVAGSTQSSPTANSDVLLLKFDSDGNLVWKQSWDFGGNEDVSVVKVNPGDGNLILGGRTRVGTNADDALLMKVADPGSTPPQNPVWAKTWSISWEGVNDVCFGPNGAIYATAQTIPQGSNGIDAYLAKYDSNGNLQWLRTWNRAVNDAGRSCTSDASGNIYLAALSGEWAGSAPHAVALLKFDPSLHPNEVLQWAQTWATGHNDAPAEAVLGSDDNIYVAGSTPGFDGSQVDALLLKYDPSGTLLSRTIRRGNGDSGALSATPLGGALYLAGFAANTSGSWQDFVGTATPGPTDTVTRIVSDEPVFGMPTNVVWTAQDLDAVGVEDAGGGGFDAFVAQIRLSQAPETQVSGAVINKNRVGVMDVIVAHVGTKKQRFPLIQKVKTDANGGFSFDDIRPNEYILPISSGVAGQSNNNHGTHGLLLVPAFYTKCATCTTSNLVFNTSEKPPDKDPAITFKMPLPEGNWLLTVEAGGYAVCLGKCPDVDDKSILADADPAHTDDSAKGMGGFYSLDFDGACGTAVLAAVQGKVVFTGKDPLFGWNVVIEHPWGIYTRYAHLLEKPAVSKNDTVSQGQVIGYMGGSGASTGEHLHFQVYSSGQVSEGKFTGESKSGHDLLRRIRLETTWDGDLPLTKFLAGRPYRSTNSVAAPKQCPTK
ncbi:MAG: M23 family metallopeptidase [Acidobacteria bacterium]|nr:M23 family metallopeptidase [Acidobacteriota bacterium]